MTQSFSIPIGVKKFDFDASKDGFDWLSGATARPQPNKPVPVSIWWAIVIGAPSK